MCQSLEASTFYNRRDIELNRIKTILFSGNIIKNFLCSNRNNSVEINN